MFIFMSVPSKTPTCIVTFVGFKRQRVSVTSFSCIQSDEGLKTTAFVFTYERMCLYEMYVLFCKK